MQVAQMTMITVYGGNKKVMNMVTHKVTEVGYP